MEGAIDQLESELGIRSEALRGRDAEVERLCAEEGELRDRISQREQQSDLLRAQLASARERADEELRSLTVLGRQLEELQIGARGQATRIRLGALREAAELSARLADAADAAPGAQRERLLDALEDAIDRVSGEWEAETPSPPLSRVPAARSQAGARSEQRPPGRRVSVDIGPFDDFSQLVHFEDAANAIGATGDISIKRFSEGRARIDMALSEPIDLLRELEERCDLEFKVRSTGDDEIVLDVSDVPNAS